MDGGEVGELEFEKFQCCRCKDYFLKGRNVHPGYAKNKMINSIRVANQFIAMLPSMETPEQTEGYEGFYHLISIQGDVEQSTVSYIIRDHDRAKFEKRKEEIKRLVAEINTEYGEGTATLELRDQYYNMREKNRTGDAYHRHSFCSHGGGRSEAECEADSWRYGWSAAIIQRFTLLRIFLPAVLISTDVMSLFLFRIWRRQ